MRTLLLLGAALASAIVARAPLDAQVRPVYDLGAAGLTQILERLQTTASALHVGAHPDDEDSAFIARTARGDNARVAYLSLNRGEGGQNIIGTELFEALGVIRTEELLQARALDGGQQYFTRTIDYGFSKTREEAAAKWNEREVLDDMVRVIRAFRPLVVNSRFTGTAADGHGQHQLAGALTPVAFRAAADPQQFPHHFAEGLRPWQPRKLYVTMADPRAAAVETGALDPVIGRSYAEIAAEGRSQHKSQEMGSIERRGPARSLLTLVESRVAAEATNANIFDGIDTTIPGIAALTGLPDGALAAELETIRHAASRALAEYQPREPRRIVPILVDGLRATRAVRERIGSVIAQETARADADFLLALKEGEFEDALASAAGVIVDPLADREVVVGGSTLRAQVRVFFDDTSLITVRGVELLVPPGWTATSAAAPQPAGPGAELATFARAFDIAVPPDAPLTQPYYLQQRRDGDRYSWPDNSPKTLPFAPALVRARVSLEIAGVAVTIVRDTQYRFADRVRGELRRHIHVVPAIVVGVDSPLIIVPVGTAPSRQRITVRAASFAAERTPATIRLRLPAGWRSTPSEIDMTLDGGAASSTAFVVSIPAQRSPGRETIAVEATSGGVRFTSDVQTIAYPHIQTHRIYRSAAVTAQVIDVKVAPVRVGYVMGSGDQVADALRRLGVNVTLLSDELLATGDLSAFDTIVVGVRASEARPRFASEHARLLEWVRNGGTLIVQYQQTDYVARNLPPLPAFPPKGRGNSRVTVETAPVRILAPTHPVFTFPNRITTADFDGWVQERNLYAFDTFDPRYTALLESADPGEPPQTGGQVYADVGRGRYVYTAYSWFRQLPAGVPGAYRQLANLISLPRAPRNAGSRAQGASPQSGAAVPGAAGRTRQSR